MSHICKQHPAPGVERVLQLTSRTLQFYNCIQCSSGPTVPSPLAQILLPILLHMQLPDTDFPAGSLSPSRQLLGLGVLGLEALTMVSL
jgi:hypothetical protein